jgi:hypothetical protein
MSDRLLQVAMALEDVALTDPTVRPTAVTTANIDEGRFIALRITAV